MRLRPLIESLEDRTVLSTIMWNTTVAPNGGDWDTAANWVGGVIPTASNDVVVDLTSSGTITHSKSINDTANSLTTTNASLSLTSGSIALGSGSSSVGTVTVGIGATLSVGAGATLQILTDHAITDNGTLSFGTGAMVTLPLGGGSGNTTAIVVNGTFTATGATFAQSGTDTSNVATIEINAGSSIQSTTVTGDIFNLPISVPAADVPLLANNLSFENVDINAGTLASGTVTMNLLGTVSTANMQYVFPGNFTIALGATLDFGPDVPVLIQADQAVTDSGTLGFSTGDMVTLPLGGGSGNTTAIVVNGTFAATGTTFAQSGTDTENVATIELNAGSTIQSTNVTANNVNLPISVTVADAPLLANNLSFENVNIDAGTLASGTVMMNLLGTASTANMQYVFPGNFTIALGATLAFGPTVPVLIQADQSVTDQGTLSFSTGDMVTLALGGGSGNTTAIVVHGTFAATGTTFAQSGTDTENVATIELNTGSSIQSTTVTGDIFNLPISVPVADAPLLANNLSFEDVNIDAGTLASGTVMMNLLGTASTTNMQYVFPGNFTIGSGATLAFGPTVLVLIQADQALTDSGTLSFSAGDMVTLALGGGSGNTTAIVVKGTFAATSTTFAQSGTDTENVATIELNAGSSIQSTTVTGNIFNLPISVPVADAPLLANNLSFENVNIDAGTLASGTIMMNLLGTASTTNMQYVFPGNFTIALGATLAFGPTVPVLIQADQALTDSGTLSFSTGDMVTLALGGGSGNTTAIVVNGTFAATGTTFAQSGTDTENVATIELNAASSIQSTTVTGNTFNLPISVPVADAPLLANNLSFENVNIDAGTLASGTVMMNLLGTASTTDMQYVFPGNFTIASGATLAFGPTVPVLIQADQALTDNGTLSFSAGDMVTLALGGGSGNTTAIVVNGTFAATGTTFAQSGTDTENVATIELNATSSIQSTTVTGNTFNLPISVPVADAPLLANNLSFENVNIDAGTLASGTVMMNLLGTSTTNMQYVFPGNFTIASGAILAFGPTVPVLIQADQLLTDTGTLNFSPGDTVTLALGGGSGNTTAIVVNGTFTALGTTFAQSGTDTENVTAIEVNSGGKFTAAGGSFAQEDVDFNSGSTDTLQYASLATKLNVNSGATLTVASDDLSSASATVVASGTSTATIHLENNYWGSTTVSVIQAKITDHTTNSSLPTVSFQPFVTSRATTAATSTSAASGASAVALSATVSSGAGTVNEGTETFTILNGTMVIGSPLTVNVSAGAAKGNYTLPHRHAGRHVYDRGRL